MLPSLWDGCRRCCHAQENLGQRLSSPYHKAKVVPTLLCPSDDFDWGKTAVQGAGAQSPVRDGEEEQGSPGDIPGWEEVCQGISADCRLMSKSSFPGQASRQGLAILARWCHPSMGLLPALGQPSRVEEKEGASQQPASLRSLQGCLGTPGATTGGGGHNHRPEKDAMAPLSIHPRLLEVTCPRKIQTFWEIKTSQPAILPSVWLVLPVVPGGARAATSLQDAAS